MWIHLLETNPEGTQITYGSAEMTCNRYYITSSP